MIKNFSTAIVMILWTLIQLGIGGFYDVITWSMLVISIPAVGIAFWNYFTMCEQVKNGSRTEFFGIPVR